MQTRFRSACCVVHGLPVSSSTRCQGRAHRSTALRQGLQYRSVSFKGVLAKSQRDRIVCSRSGLTMTASATKTVLVPLGNGTEEMEAVTIIDVMRRAGAAVTVASVESDLTVKCSRDVKIVADELISHAAKRQFDLIVLPVRSEACIHEHCLSRAGGHGLLFVFTQGGAPGSEALKQSNDLRDLLHKQQSDDKPYAAMCAAPAVVLEAHGLLKGKKATAHPAFVSKLTDSRCDLPSPKVLSRKNAHANTNLTYLFGMQCC